MADPVSLGLAIGQASLTAGKIIFTLSAFINDAAKAPEQIRQIRNETSNVEVSLRRLHTILQADKSAIPHANELPLEALVDLATIVTNVVMTLSELHEKTESLKMFRSLFDRAKWALQQGSVTKILQRLQNDKSSLQLSFAILQW